MHFEPTEREKELIIERAKKDKISLSDALFKLYWEGVIGLYDDDDRCTESDWSTDEIDLDGPASENCQYTEEYS